MTQENHYDPWGVGIEREVVSDTSKLPKFELRDRFTYNGKELQGTLNYLDYGARMYDPSIGRWGVVDPLAEKFSNLTSYNYVGGNPVRNTDPTGMSCKGCGKDGESISPPEINGHYAYIGTCPTCPNSKEYDIYRDNKSLFTYDSPTGIVYNGEGSASVTAKCWTREDEVAYQFVHSFQYNPHDDRDYGAWRPHGFGLQGGVSLGGAGMNFSGYGGLYFDDYGVTTYGGYEFSMGYLSEYYNTYIGNIIAFYGNSKTNGAYLGPLSVSISESGKYDSKRALQAAPLGIRSYGLGFEFGSKSFGKGPIPLGGMFTSGSNTLLYKTFDYRKRPTKII
ncbi:RHS repeat-associated core domain-containing protein [Emticicia fluvialis]|uniref:RHS repeat-associated core domain-containing protein n=1 Tax=Emticicia fluvialis TaxID=2974474 RepID=UPI00216651A6|nr:RHS repeat-associated core domain-containing protein [Emticicia fluvialis]